MGRNDLALAQAQAPTRRPLNLKPTSNPDPRDKGGGAEMARAKMAVATLIALMLFSLPATSFSDDDCAPCDITVESCPAVNPIGILLELHPCPGQVVCFKFYRKECGSSIWTLIHEGPSNIYCDTAYLPGDCVQYMGERWGSIKLGPCDRLKCQTAPSNCSYGC